MLDSINLYNENIKNGGDELFFKQISDYKIKPIKSAPYYAMKVIPLINYTQGGVAIDKNARVLNLNHKPLLNIYAIGEAAGGVSGESRLISTSSTECVVFGLIAANDIQKL